MCGKYAREEVGGHVVGEFLASVGAEGRHLAL